ncbi:unnamed protein product [Staurois parvus]|uniref:Uncharacterized protein n=1 Tax=Staurois parvus TaxID=386267 RepID=A0ABN9F2Y6_9NEOB|nr:unnamed protein product [Staurois parvus]
MVSPPLVLIHHTKAFQAICAFPTLCRQWIEICLVPAETNFDLLMAGCRLEFYFKPCCGWNRGGLTTHGAPGNSGSWGPCVLAQTQKSL